MNYVPGFNTAQLKEFLLKLQIPAVEEMPGHTMSEAGDVSCPVTYHVILHCCITWYILVLYRTLLCNMLCIKVSIEVG